MAFNTSRTFTSRGRPPRLAGGIAGSTSAHSASVKSLGYRKPRRSAARRCSGVHIEHPLESIRVLDNESHPIPSTQQLLGSALSARFCCLLHFFQQDRLLLAKDFQAIRERLKHHFGGGYI